MSSTYPQRPASTLAALPTPCLLLDRDILTANLTRMAGQVAARGVHFRPHLKTAKCAEIARLAAPLPGGAITVSTLREAEYFAHHGWRDIFYAVGLGPGKLARAAALVRDGAQLVTMVDHPAAATAVSDFATRENVRFRTVIEIDCGDRRGGVSPDGEELLAIAKLLGTNFAGVATHGGHSYDQLTEAGRNKVAKNEAKAVRTASLRLQRAGFPHAMVSLGSSPTAIAEADLTGITEIRAGVYMFWDLYQGGIGVCRVEDIAITVLAEVIGRPASRPNEFLIDAGAFALSKDASTSSLPEKKNAGYGWLCDLDGLYLPGLKVDRVWQEHGRVVSAKPLPDDRFQIGSRVRVLPNHACPTAAAHDRYFVLSQGNVVAEWPRVNGW